MTKENDKKVLNIILSVCNKQQKCKICSAKKYYELKEEIDKFKNIVRLLATPFKN